MMLGQRADIASVEAINKDLGLDKPIHVQYLSFLNDVSPLSVYNIDDPESFWYFSPDKYSGREMVKFGHQALGLKKPYLRRSYTESGQGAREENSK